MYFGDHYNVEKNVKVGSGHIFVVLSAHVRVLTPINGSNFDANFA